MISTDNSKYKMIQQTLDGIELGTDAQTITIKAINKDGGFDNSINADGTCCNR